MNLSQNQIRHLKALGHSLKPVVMVGAAGLSEGVYGELEVALNHHELIKVKIAGAEREDKKEMIEALAARSGATVIQTIGHIALIFRRNREKPRIELPKK